jgi:pimeloyl-ACP methyl ester carboxylesterase
MKVPALEKKAQTFVLVHGSWQGGWCWRNVAIILRAQGHTVYTPTLTGMGERSHLLTGFINLDTHVTDIKALINAEELEDVVLVGHSYGGLITAILADQIPEKIQKLIFLDVPIPSQGENLMQQLPAEVQEITMQLVRELGEGIGIPPIPAVALGIPDGPEADWVNRRLTFHPLNSQTQPFVLKNPIGNGIPKTFISCVNPVLFVLEETIPKVKDNPDWQFFELATGHESMITDPAGTADLLMR